MGGIHEDPGLAEVKAILTKLQRIDLAAERGADKSIIDATPPSVLRAPAGAPAPAAIKLFERKHAAIIAVKPGKSSRRRIAAYILGVGTFVAGAAVLIAAGKINAPGPEPAALAVHKENASALVAEARRLLNDGNVALARDSLLRAEPERRAEAAFMLAQSYDPNYLHSLPKANSLPDKFEAERWYKKWHELAVQSGLEMDNGRLQRIINAMR